MLPRCSRWGTRRSKITHPYQPSPIPFSGRPAHRPFRGLLGVHSRCGLHTRTITKFVTVTRGLQTFHRLHACPGCFRRKRSPGGLCTHWKSAALSRPTSGAPGEAGAPEVGSRRTWIADLRRHPLGRQGCAESCRSAPFLLFPYQAGFADLAGRIAKLPLQLWGWRVPGQTLGATPNPLSVSATSWKTALGYHYPAIPQADGPDE
jgi:hypothetical protein